MCAHVCMCVCWAGEGKGKARGSAPQLRASSSRKKLKLQEAEEAEASSSRTQEAEAAWPFDRDPMLCLVQGIFKFSFILLSGFPPHLPSPSQVSRLLGPSSH